MVLCGVTVEMPHDDVSHVGVANVKSAFAISRCLNDFGITNASPSSGSRCCRSIRLPIRQLCSIALSGGRLSVGPPEFCSVLDDAGEDDGELACKRDTRSLEADAFSESEAPGLEAGEPFDDRQKHGGRFVQQGSDHPVAPFRDAPLVVDLSGLVPARRQAEVSSHLTRLGETAAVVDRTQECQSDDWANAWYWSHCAGLSR